ncbi:MAG: inositol monophosphatase [Candidatus Aenigmarchaeota archaeon]|nr:inositol monophosphatase [Candidatus Aenigmarchaeota archaeon]
MNSHLDDAVKAAETAGKILSERFNNPKVKTKNIKDVVTDADLESENAIKKFLMEKYPDYGFLGEETGFKKGNKTWVVDPIDGTRAFSFGIPNFSVSIALVENGKSMVGVVYNPMTGETFTSEKGGGAFFNGKLIGKSAKEKPTEECLVGCTFQYHRKELLKLEENVNVCLVNFSPALDVCRVAQGRIDAAVHGLTEIFDHAAASLIAVESGLKITNFGKKSWDIVDLGILAASPAIHGRLEALFPEPLRNLDKGEKFYTKKYEL